MVNTVLQNRDDLNENDFYPDITKESTRVNDTLSKPKLSTPNFRNFASNNQNNQQQSQSVPPCQKILLTPANTKFNFATLNVEPISYLGCISMFNCNLNTS